MFELWARSKDTKEFKKIEEFKRFIECEYKIDEVLATGEYLEALVVMENRYIIGKEYKEKVKRIGK